MTVLVDMVYGSHLYGLNTPESDTDYKGIIIPDFDFIISEQKFVDRSSTGDQHSRNGAGDVDRQMFSLMGFMKMAYKGETTAIDMLHANPEHILQSSPEWEWLQTNRKLFYTRSMSSYIGYCRKQAAKYCIKGSRLDAIQTVKQYLTKASTKSGYTTLSAPDIRAGLEGIAMTNEFVSVVDGFQKGDKWIDKTVLIVCEAKHDFTSKIEYVIDSLQKKYDSYGERAKLAEKNEGVDWKALSHALRVGYQAREIFINGDFEYPLKETQIIMDVKQGKMNFSDTKVLLEELVDEVIALSKNSDLPDTVDTEPFDVFCRNTYRDRLMGKL